MNRHPKTKNKRILFLSVPLIGHMKPLIAIAEEMLNRGYGCTFGVQRSGAKWAEEIEGLDVIEDESTSFIDPQYWQKLGQLKGKNPGVKAEKRMGKLMLPIVQKSNYESVQKIIQRVNPDLIIVEKTMIPGMDMAVKAGIPYIEVTDLISYRGRNLLKFPAPSSSRSFPLKGLGYLGNLVDLITLFFAYYPFGVLGQIEKMRRQFQIPVKGSHPLDGVLSICSNVHGLELSRPIPENLKLVGPVLRRQEELSGQIKGWVEQDRLPIIYISMGSLAKVSSELIEKTFLAFGNKPVRVLWSLPQEQQTYSKAVPENFRVETFVDQQAVLAHEQTKLFISHCGINSVSEALYYHTPIIACPFFCDQHYWAARIQENCFGLKIDKSSFTADELGSKAEKVILDEGNLFQKSILRIANVMRKSGGTEQACNLIESTL